MPPETHYQTLEINETATQAEIKRAYRRLAKQFHPDSQTS
ncbi:MAG: DnaJ domain-containing protein, partial [Nodosilinea sp.]